METTPNGWTIIDREAGVLTRDYTFAKGAHATTFVARLENGELMVMSPSVDLSDAAAAELLEFGEVGAIVAHNGFHHLGQRSWRDRYPKARCFAPLKASERIKKKSKAALEFEPMSALESLTGPNLTVRELPNTKLGECWAWAKINGGNAWFMSDVLVNMTELPKAFMPRLMFKLTKSAPGFKVFHLALKFVVKDKKATLRLLLEDLNAHEPTVVIPGHGAILDQASIAADTRALIEAAL